MPQQGVSYKKPLHCCDVFWFPVTPTLWQSPHKHMSPVISRRSILQVACVLHWSIPSLIPSLLLCTGCVFQEKLQGLDLILFDFGSYAIGTSSMAQQMPINTCNFTHKCNIIYQQDYELHGKMFFRAKTYPLWYSQKWYQTLQLTWNVFEKFRLSVHLPSQVHMHEAVFLCASKGT